MILIIIIISNQCKMRGKEYVRIKQFSTQTGMNGSLIIDSLYFRSKGNCSIKVNKTYYMDFYGAHIFRH